MGCASSGVYQKPFGAGDVSLACLTRDMSVTPGGFFKLGLEKSIGPIYNMLSKRAESWMRPAAGKIGFTRVAPYLTRTRALFFACHVNCKSYNGTKHNYKLD